MADPIFALPFRELVLLVGLAELVVAGLCLFTSKRTLSLGLLAWLVVTLAAYRVGIWTMGWHHPYAWVAGLINGLDISPWVADLMIGATSAYLLIGSVAMLWFERRTAQAATSLKMSCPSCGGHIKFAIQNLGQQIPCPHCQAVIALSKSDLLKMTCYFCKGHIEFPAHALGQKVSLPALQNGHHLEGNNMNIRLKYLEAQEWLKLARCAEWSVGKLAKLCNVSVRGLELHFLKQNGQNAEELACRTTTKTGRGYIKQRVPG